MAIEALLARLKAAEAAPALKDDSGPGADSGSDEGPEAREREAGACKPQGLPVPQTADEGRFAERAAMLEHDDELPRAEAERLAAAEQGFASPEALFDAVVSRWDDGLRRIGGLEGDPQGQRCIRAALAFIADGWAATALRCGWTELELVGACPRAPWERLDRLGAAYSTFPVLAVTGAEILYASTRAPLRRLRGAQADGAWLPWNRLASVPRCVLTESEMPEWLPPKRPGVTAVGWEIKAHDLLRAWRVAWPVAERLVKRESAAHDWRPGRGAP